MRLSCIPPLRRTRHPAILLALLFLLALPASLSATWSVVAIDRETGRIVIASATCVSAEGLRSRGGLMSIQAIVVPGSGVAAAQAGVDSSRENQRLIHRELQAGADPRSILERLMEDSAIQHRQFGILDMEGRFVGFSGSENGASSLARGGRVPGTELYYGIQGNILASDDVVHDAVQAFVEAGGELTDRAMAAMEAADAAGGDSRCSCESEPQVEAPCHDKSAHVAYIVAADPDDPQGETFNDGDYGLFIDVDDENIRPDENANPVATLRMRYDAWREGRPAPSGP